MADRRMIAKSVVMCDSFLNLPLSAQALYFHLCLGADDDGFINNAKMIQRMIGVNNNELSQLVEAGFIIEFASGVVLVKHWKISNLIRADRYTPTSSSERRLVKLNAENVYELVGNRQGKKDLGVYADDVRKVVDNYNLMANTKYSYNQLNKTILAAFEKGQTVETLIKLTDKILSKGETVSPSILYSGEYVEAKF